jgi:hypothetical protein
MSSGADFQLIQSNLLIFPDILRKLSRDRDAGNHHDRHEDDEMPLFGTRERNVKLLRWGRIRYFLSRFSAATLKSWTPIIIRI